MVGMSVLSQLISATSFQLNWSEHPLEVQKQAGAERLATTEKLVYVYSNSKMVASDSRC